MGNKSHNLADCSSLQSVVFCSFSEIESTFPKSFWGYVIGRKKLCCTVSIYFVRSPVHAFLLTGKQVKNVSRAQPQNFCWFGKRFQFLRFRDDRRNIFVNTSKGNNFIFLAVFVIIFALTENLKEHGKVSL